ncbi:oligosaccharide flippase family protein [Pseudohaliea sp.]|uniref:oligosaccharide flippase family protein n=1 Tax=Pseudohaliea sp. TaxID=2740289 RepID=UPI0032EE87A7
MLSTRRALAYTFSAQYLALAIQFAATVVIARLLTPAEIGIFSVGAALIGLAHLLRDFGSGQYIVQEEELTEDRIRAAFTVTLFLGWSLAAIILLIAPIAASYYEQAGLRPVLTLLSLNFILLPFGSITQAYCRREMNFKPSALASVASTLVQSSTSVLLAFNGFSYMSLAWASIAGTLTTISVLFLMRPAGLPFLPGFRELRRVLGFGSKLSLVYVLVELGNVVPELVLGKVQSFHAVGLFSRTQGTISMFDRLVMQGIGPVIGPVFAQQKRADQDIKAAFMFGTTCVTGLAWAFYSNLVVLAKPAVLILFGEKWIDTVPLIQMWCVAAVIGQLTSLVEQAFTNIGEVDRLMRFSAIMQPIRIMLLGASAAAGLEYLLLAIMFLPIIRFILLWPHLSVVFGVRLNEYLGILRTSGSPAAISAAVALMVSISVRSIGDAGLLVEAFLASVAAVLVWAVMLLLVEHPLAKEVRQMLEKF